MDSSTENGPDEPLSDDDIHVVFKTIHGKQFEVVVPKDIMIRDLKAHIAKESGLEPVSQRFIFQGRSLDDDTARLHHDCHVQDKNVIHLVTKVAMNGRRTPTRPTGRHSSSQMASNNRAQQDQSPTTGQELNQADGAYVQAELLVHTLSLSPQTILLTIMQQQQQQQSGTAAAESQQDVLDHLFLPRESATTEASMSESGDQHPSIYMIVSTPQPSNTRAAPSPAPALPAAAASQDAPPQVPPTRVQSTPQADVEAVPPGTRHVHAQQAVYRHVQQLLRDQLQSQSRASLSGGNIPVGLQQLNTSSQLSRRSFYVKMLMQIQIDMQNMSLNVQLHELIDQGNWDVLCDMLKNLVLIYREYASNQTPTSAPSSSSGANSNPPSAVNLAGGNSQGLLNMLTSSILNFFTGNSGGNLPEYASSRQQQQQQQPRVARDSLPISADARRPGTANHSSSISTTASDESPTSSGNPNALDAITNRLAVMDLAFSRVPAPSSRIAVPTPSSQQQPSIPSRQSSTSDSAARRPLFPSAPSDPSVPQQQQQQQQSGLVHEHFVNEVYNWWNHSLFSTEWQEMLTPQQTRLVKMYLKNATRSLLDILSVVDIIDKYEHVYPGQGATEPDANCPISSTDSWISYYRGRAAHFSTPDRRAHPSPTAAPQNQFFCAALRQIRSVMVELLDHLIGTFLGHSTWQSESSTLPVLISRIVPDNIFPIALKNYLVQYVATRFQTFVQERKNDRSHTSSAPSRSVGSSHAPAWFPTAAAHSIQHHSDSLLNLHAPSSSSSSSSRTPPSLSSTDVEQLISFDRIRQLSLPPQPPLSNVYLGRVSAY